MEKIFTFSDDQWMRVEFSKVTFPVFFWKKLKWFVKMVRGERKKNLSCLATRAEKDISIYIYMYLKKNKKRANE